MVRIRFEAPTTVHLPVQAGDEVHVQAISPELQAVLNARRVDGQAVARVVRGRDESIPEVDTDEELAVPTRGRRRSG